MLRKIIPFTILIALLSLVFYLGLQYFGVSFSSLLGGSIKDQYHNASLEYSFDDLDSKVKPILDNYLLSYNYSTNADSWTYKKYYSLDEFSLLIFVFDKQKKNIDAAYMVMKTNNGFSGDIADMPKISNPTSTAKAVRLLDKGFSKRIINSRNDSGNFGLYSEHGIKYLYFFVDKDYFDRDLSAFDINQEVGFFAHEGFHLTAQSKFKWPKHKSGSLRFDLPDDYPVDPSSFSLIAAGYKLYENVLFDDSIDLNHYAKMYDLLFNKLLELDHSGKDYVNEFFFFETWLEGAAEFVELKLNSGSGVFDGSDRIIRYSNSFQRFNDGIDDAIEKGVSTSSINGVEKLVKYTDVLDGSYYKIGAGCLLTLDGLGVDVMAGLKDGLTPYQILEKYLQESNLNFDEDVVYNDLKQEINWQESLAKMKKYIELFD